MSTPLHKHLELANGQQHNESVGNSVEKEDKIEREKNQQTTITGNNEQFVERE